MIIASKNFGGLFLIGIKRIFACLGWRQTDGLPVRNLGVDDFGGAGFVFGEFQIPKDTANQRELVVGIINRKITGDTSRLMLDAKELDANAVEGAHIW